MQKQLTKSQEKVWAGVCGGIAEYLGWDKTIVRLLTVALAVFGGFFPIIILYLVGAVIIPEKPHHDDNTIEGEFHERK